MSAVGVLPFCGVHPDDRPDPSCAGCVEARAIRADADAHRDRYGCTVWPLCSCERDAGK